MKFKLKLTGVLLMLLSLSTMVDAQEYSIDNIGRSRLQNSGTIMEGNLIKGYYYFYKSEKVDRKNNAYEVLILDENLNEKSSERIIEPKHTYMMEASYNGGFLMFKFYDTKSKSVSYRSMDNAGEISDKETREANKYEIMTYNSSIANDLENSSLHSVNDKLFIDLHNFKEKDYKFAMEGLNNNGEILWTYEPTNAMKIETGQFLGNSKDQVWIQIAKSKGIMSRAYTFDLLGVNSDGEEDFRVSLQTSRYNLLAHNASYNKDKDEIVILGEYYDIKDKSMKSDSKGIFVKVLSPDGDEVSEDYISWTRDVASFVSSEDKRELSKYYVFFHNIVQTSDGRILAIGEQYRKQVSAGGVAANILAASSGNVTTDAGMTEIKIGKMIVIELSPEYELTAVDLHDKKPRKEILPQGYGTVSQHLIAKILKSEGSFDYQYMQTNEDKSVVSFAYQDLEKVKGKLRKQSVLNFISYVGSEEEYTTDKLELNSDAFYIWYMPAKPGYILVLEYFRKEKSLEMRLEPINY
jgi:hypothetical protein